MWRAEYRPAFRWPLETNPLGSGSRYSNPPSPRRSSCESDEPEPEPEPEPQPEVDVCSGSRRRRWGRAGGALCGSSGVLSDERRSSSHRRIRSSAARWNRSEPSPPAPDRSGASSSLDRDRYGPAGRTGVAVRPVRSALSAPLAGPARATRSENGQLIDTTAPVTGGLQT